MPRTSPVIVTAPDGTEYRFSSCKAAGELVGASGSTVSQQCAIGNPTHGYRVRYARINRMGQLMEET